jgi:deoxyadenosine/deoxycytidine kinase
MIVWISGPTGGGKSSLAQIFGVLGYAVVQEKLPRELFQTFAADPKAHCGLLQEEIMLSRFESWRALDGGQRVVFDRSIDEDLFIFCRMHRELGFLNDEQYRYLRAIAEDLQRIMPAPDLILFMCPERRVIARRVGQTSHPSQIVESLDRQLTLYSEWIATRREDILRLDNSDCALNTMQRLFSEKL